MINHKHKFIFIHIPKTGGTSIEKYILGNANVAKKQNNKHNTVTEYMNKTGKLFDKYFSFSFVRNPYDFLVSYYKFRMNMINGEYGRVERFMYKKYSKSNFRNWVMKNFYNDPRVMTNLDFLSYNSEIKVDFIGKFENLQQDFDTVCDKIGIPQQKLPHINKSKHKHYTEYYDDETREIVAKKYAKDIEYFGYKFGK
jgi:hypothetical protein